MKIPPNIIHSTKLWWLVGLYVQQPREYLTIDFLPSTKEAKVVLDGFCHRFYFTNKDKHLFIALSHLEHLF